MQQELKSEQTKQIIIDKAFDLFYENGFKSTSVKTIMTATKLSKGAFYHHYKNKEAIGLEVIQSKVQQRVHDKMIVPLKRKGDALDIISDTFLERIKSYPDYDKIHGCSLNNFINEIGDYETTYQQALKGLIEQWKGTLIELIERGKAEKSIRNDMDSSAVAVYLISAFEGIRGIRKLYDDDQIIEEYTNGLSVYIQQLKA